MSTKPAPTRCPWALQGNSAYIRYHDETWGVPVHNDTEHFTMLTLESAQAGLSWQTVLNKIDGYKTCFAHFDIHKVATFDEKKMQALCQDARIIRNKLKIRATVHNARCFLALQKTFGTFDTYIWSFVNHKPIINHWQKESQVPATTPLAQHISKDLKRHGFKFIGPTILYAYMQAIGLVNDHLITCFRHQPLTNNPHH